MGPVKSAEREWEMRHLRTTLSFVLPLAIGIVLVKHGLDFGGGSGLNFTW